VCAWPGLRLVADRSYRAVRGPIDTLIVTGVDGPDDAKRDPDLVRWLARMAPRTRRIVGLCTGSFVLAEADSWTVARRRRTGLSATSWRGGFPASGCSRTPSTFATAASTHPPAPRRGWTLCWRWVEEDLGRRVALAVAQWMVVFPQAAGREAQFSVQLSTQMADREPLREMQAWVLDHPGADLSVEALARR